LRELKMISPVLTRKQADGFAVAEDDSFVFFVCIFCFCFLNSVERTSAAISVDMCVILLLEYIKVKADSLAW
jgi:hypothetical protein